MHLLRELAYRLTTVERTIYQEPETEQLRSLPCTIVGTANCFQKLPLMPNTKLTYHVGHFNYKLISLKGKRGLPRS